MKLIFASIVVVPMFFSCSSNNEQQGIVDKEMAQLQSDIDKARSEVAEQESGKMNEQRAEHLATRHLALKQVKWGKPTKVTEDDGHYYMIYETPDRELRLIGERKLIVNKETGLVTAQKRR